MNKERNSIIMGYQEAYIRTVNKNDMDEFINYIKSLDKEYFDKWGSYPVEIITFNKNHFPFNKGDKTIYFVGERFPLHSIFYKDEDYNEYFLNNKFSLFVTPTEEVESKGIWKDSGDVTDCVHEEFIL